ncbi:hypothetical protein [Methylobacter luteus]|uniref:hypothetical protein n=1 Tax=Methylobacter luteus TaxID=415 RepID=UPI0004823A5C|nr:hypothetical protein [Methylobacter luteus]
MKKIIGLAFLVAATGSYADSVTGKYSKEDAVVEISETKGGVNFEISSVVDQSSCNVSGTAKIIDAHRAAWTPDDPENQCSIVINFKDNNNLTVTTKDCFYYCGVAAGESMDGDYKKTASESVERYPDNVDFNAAALMMYSSYIGYQNGVAAMYDKEESCWKEIGSDLNHAKYCVAASLAGGIIEAGYARQEGRVSAPNYQPDAMKNRIVERMKQHGFSEDETNSARDYVGLNAMKVIAGLANAGMR